MNYTINVSGRPGPGWAAAFHVSCYRDVDDQHVHTAERSPLDVALREVKEAITADIIALEKERTG